MQTFFYSPLSATNVAERNNPVLLLLFILKEMIKDPQGLIDDLPCASGPLAWTLPGSSSQKLREHFSLLPLAFPTVAAPILKKGQTIQELFLHIEPFIATCALDENLLLFLIRHQKELAVKELLGRICPEGIDAIQDRIAENFRKRGYHFTRWIHSYKML